MNNPQKHQSSSFYKHQGTRLPPSKQQTFCSIHSTALPPKADRETAGSLRCTVQAKRRASSQVQQSTAGVATVRHSLCRLTLLTMASPGTKKRSHSGESHSTEISTKSNSASSNKRIKHDTPSGQNVRVVARIRPLSSKEIGENSKHAVSVVSSLDRPRTISINTAIGSHGGSSNSPKSFEYDGAFGPSTSQKELYEHTVGDMVRNNIFKGFNVTVMAYGQTGSGKVRL